MKFLVFVSLACLAAFANASGVVNVYGAYDDGQWHGEGLWESQDHESLAARAYAYGVAPAVPYAAHVPAPVPWAAARALPVPHAVTVPHAVPAAYSVPVAAPAVPVAHGYSASISGPSGHIGALS